MNNCKIFTLPGLYNSGPEHWQTYWEKKYGFLRISQKNWETPSSEEWLSTIETAIGESRLDQVILIGHSLACCAIVQWAEIYNHVIKGALLVAPSDTEAPSFPMGPTGFSSMPLFKLPFSSVIIASSNDEYVSMERASYFAKNWGSQLVNAGAIGHINSASDLGNWQQGFDILQKCLKAS